MGYYRSAAAFAPASVKQTSSALNEQVDRRAVFGQIAGAASAFAIAAPALADRDYNEVGLLGGGNVVDINNGKS